MAVYKFSKSKQGKNYLTDHFQVEEFACNDGSDEVLIDLDLVYKLEVLRSHFNTPIIISSGYRTPSWNQKVGGAQNSYHLDGKAFDVVAKGVSPYDLAHAAQGLWINGIGCYNDGGFVHLDSRTFPAFWKNRTVTPVSTFGNYPSAECNVRNLRLAHMTDGWTFPKKGAWSDEADEEFMAVLSASTVKKNSFFSNVNKIVQHTVGANEDGYIGDKTVQKIKKWQTANGLYPDGIFGIKSWKKALGI